MTIREVYKKLGDVRRARIHIELLLERLRELDALKTSIRSVIPQDKVQTSPNGDRLVDVIAEIDEKEVLLSRYVREWMELIEDAKSLISTVEKDHIQAVLTKRFIDCKRWEIIAMEMGYTSEWLQTLKKRGIYEIARKSRNNT